jgi:ketosteroid isomerase-like protein
MSSDKSTEAILGHHVQALMSRDLDSIMEDYADNAVMFSPNGTFKGPEGIRACFMATLGKLMPEVIQNMKVIRQEIDGDYAYVFWSSAPSIPLGSDTFCVRDGKIVMQSFIAQIKP